jgi:predicted AlkP superfamily phosphohydrolase/phosphomutase
MKSRSLGENKAVVIGLDGVPYSLLRHYIDQGVMPCLAEMVAYGRLAPLNSTLPEVSSVAWASFMTGKNPAEHGIFGFMELDRNSYDYVFPNFLSLKTSTFWESLGVPTVACNIPQTYPARPLNGIMISGFVALNLEKAVYPPRLYDYLAACKYQLDVNSQLAAKDPEAFFENLFQVFAKRVEVIEHLYDQEDWRLFIGMITETDRLHHFFFESARGGPYYYVFKEFYQKLDAFLGEMFSRSQSDNALFLTCADHGFAPIITEVYTNVFFQEQGLLQVSGKGNLKDLTPEAKVFCLEPARAYLHTQSSYRRGRVSQADYEDLREDLRSRLASLTFQGKRVVKRVYRKEEIFWGPYINEAPDLYVLGEPGFDLKASLNKTEVFGRSHFQGAHTFGDSHVFMAGPDDLNAVVMPGAIDQVPAVIVAYLQKRGVCRERRT